MMRIKKIFLYFLVFFSGLLVGIVFYQGFEIGASYVELRNNYGSLNRRMNNLEQNYKQVIRLYTLGREKKEDGG